MIESRIQAEGRTIVDRATREPAPVVEHLTKRFGDRVAFEDVSFEVGYGEPSTGLAVGLAAALLAVDALGWRAVAAMFDRERLIIGVRT